MPDRPIKSFQDLAKLRDALPAASPSQRPPAQQPTAQSPQYAQPPIDRADRAGRAPYNFVPLPGDACWLAGADAPPHADRYQPGLLSGEIEIGIEALTDFYIRGMLGESETGKQAKDQPEPFLVNGRLRIPGSSLRGLLRNLIEIMGCSPLHPVNDQQLFYRAVAATPNPNDASSFEPQAATYKSRLETVKAGYLYASSTKWIIRPAKPAGLAKPAYLYATSDIWRREAISYVPDGFRARRCHEKDPGARKGWLVCSGRMRGKKNQWIVPEEDPSGKQIEIPPEDVDAYLEAGKTQEIEKNHFQYGRREDYRKGVPCFFVTWRAEGAGGVEREYVAFGHTPNFRMPYLTTTGLAVPPNLRRAQSEPKWDLAQAMFGRTTTLDEKRKEISGAKGRIFVEDALLQGQPAGQFQRESAAVVLGAPKPTTYQHYLVQPSSRVDAALHWDGDYRSKGASGKAVVRGHKLYWHRPNAPIKPADDKQQRVETKLKVAHRGLQFRAVVRYENLRPWELGALLRSLELPPGCAHKLGMAKPLGLGSMRFAIVAHRQINRVERYQAFFSNDGKSLRTGASPVSDASVPVKEFDRKFGWDWDNNVRGRELKALLTFDNLPDGWHNRTRYLEFGKISPPNGRPYIYNEYSHSGYPGPSLTNKRRPLPPPTQVIRPGQGVPADDRPPFEGPRLRPDLRGGRR